MKERLSHIVATRMTDTDVRRLKAVGGYNSIWLRSAIRSQILLNEVKYLKVNSDESNVSEPS